MFKRILFPLDVAGAVAAREVIEQLAQADESHVLVVHIADVHDTEESIAARRAELVEYGRQLRDYGFDVEIAVKRGDVVEQILTLATDDRSDLVILAPRRRRQIDEFSGQSVAASLSPQITIPVLMLPEPLVVSSDQIALEAPSSLVVLPLDGSPQSEDALPYACAFAQQLRRTLLLVRIIPSTALASASPADFLTERNRRIELERDALSYLAAVRVRVGQEYEVPTQSMLLVGDPVEELVSLAESHRKSIIVIRSHGSVGVTRAIFGSVALSLARRAPALILLVPDPARATRNPPGTTAPVG